MEEPREREINEINTLIKVQRIKKWQDSNAINTQRRNKTPYT